MAEATEAPEVKKVPSKVASEIVEIDLSSVRLARALKRRKKLNTPIIDLSRIQEDRVSRNQVFEQLGITAGVVLQRHVDNLDAMSFLTIGHGSARKVYAVPDYKTRQKAVEAAEKLLGLIHEDKDLEASRPVVINLLPGTREKVEALIGETLQLAPGEIVDVQPQTPATAETNETETVDDAYTDTLEASRVPERGDQQRPQPGVQDDPESVERPEQAGDARAEPATEAEPTAAAADPEGRVPTPENGDLDFSFE